MIKPDLLSLREARAIALRSQGLAEDPAPFGPGKAAVLAAVRHLGYVQVDTVSVLQRAHHHVLWSRIPDYRPEMLHELQSPDAAVFEYWHHAASYLPMEDYRQFIPQMRARRAALHWARDTPELRASMRRMLGRIRKNGPLMLSEVESTATVAGGWSTTALGKIERRALHELWMRGDIMIRSRKGFQKVFDLPARALPPGVLTTFPSKREHAEFHVRRTLQALGIARGPELHYLQDAEHARAIRSALGRLIKRREVIECRAAEHPAIPLYTTPAALALSAPLTQARVRFLSPFDNLVIQRKRLKWLFGFDYTIEIYVPAAKRKYGYFVLPILWGDRIIGRMDAKADRSTGRLLIHSLIFELDFTEAEAFLPDSLAALQDFCRFQQCDAAVIARVHPARFRKFLPAHLSPA